MSLLNLPESAEAPVPQEPLLCFSGPLFHNPIPRANTLSRSMNGVLKVSGNGDSRSGEFQR